MLGKINHSKSSVALAQRALFDLHADVRQAAVETLQQRPRKEYLDILLAGFRYPWSPVADHAAEALVALEINEAVPELLALLDAPDPRLPVGKPQAATIKEVVRVNHLRNCVLCHAPSFDRQDKVRGLAPP